MKNYIFNIPKMNPVFLKIGIFSIHWYGLMYLIGFIYALHTGKKQIIKKNFFLSKIEIDHLIYLCFMCSIIGGRIGYITFYDTNIISEKILSLFKIWEGGMSFHGGLIGSILAIKYFCKKYNKKFLQISDFIIPLVPLGLAVGRIGNFINGELFGRLGMNLPIAFLYPTAKPFDLETIKKKPELKIFFDQFGNLPRHPSQLYEFFFEGILLFLIFNYLKTIKTPTGLLTGLFLILYGVIRTILEFFREPDIQLGLIYNLITMGQILSMPMIIFGLLIIKNAYKKIKK